MKKTLNILQLYDMFKIGGAETHIVELSKGLKKLGHKVIIASTSGDGIPWIIKNNIEFIECNLSDYTQQLRCIDEIMKIIYEYNIDVIHAHPYNSQIVGSLAGWILDVPVITTFHGPHETPGCYKNVSDLIDKFICVSEEVKSFVENKNQYIKDLSIIHNSVESKGIIKNKNFFKDNYITISCISRLDIDKINAILFILMSIPEISKKLRVKLNIIGDGQYYYQLKSYAEFLNKSLKTEVIHLKGSQLNINSIIEDSDIIIGVGRVILEAIANGKFAICLGNKYYPGLIDADKLIKISEVNFTDRNTSEHFTVNNLFNDICRVYNNFNEEYNKLICTQKILYEKFSIENSVEKHLLIYHDAIKQKNKKTKKWDSEIWNNKYPVSDDLSKLIVNYNIYSTEQYEFTNSKKNKIALIPSFDNIEDNWMKVIDFLLNIFNNIDDVTIIIRVQNRYQIYIEEIIRKINELLNKYKKDNLPDLMIDIEYHNEIVEAQFISSVDKIIITNKDQNILKFKCKLKNTKFVEIDTITFSNSFNSKILKNVKKLLLQ